MKLWQISQTENTDYDSYDSAVVAAETEELARNMEPDTGADLREKSSDWGEETLWDIAYYDWCDCASKVTVRYLGEAAEGTKTGVICASFNAG